LKIKHIGHFGIVYVNPERIDGLETQVVCLVASGEMHSVVVNNAGHIFTWGDNHFSQLGRQTPPEHTSSAPKLVLSLPAAVSVAGDSSYRRMS